MLKSYKHSVLLIKTSNSDNDDFRIMFPDSVIASKYSQGETKTKYMI